MTLPLPVMIVDVQTALEIAEVLRKNKGKKNGIEWGGMRCPRRYLEYLISKENMNKADYKEFRRKKP